MKKSLFTLIILLSLLGNDCWAQTQKTTTTRTNTAKSPTTRTTSATKTITPAVPDSFKNKTDSLLSNIDSLIRINNILLDHLDINTSVKGRYKMYQTENIYNLLLLDTKTGKIEQVQWSLDEKEEYSVYVNFEDLSSLNSYGSGSFELYPTKNIYQFILLDKTNGRKWHVQWGLESSKRWIRRIY